MIHDHHSGMSSSCLSIRSGTNVVLAQTRCRWSASRSNRWHATQLGDGSIVRRGFGAANTPSGDPSDSGHFSCNEIVRDLECLQIQ